MVKRGAEYLFHEFSEEEVEETRDIYRNVVQWAEADCELVPAVGKVDFPPEWGRVDQIWDAAFTDTMLAANGSDRLLVSDDKYYRAVAKAALEIEGVWLQAVLSRCRGAGLISLDEYSDFVVQLVGSGIDFTTFDIPTLVAVLKNDDWEVRPRAKRLIETFQGLKIDLVAAVEIAEEVLHIVWVRENTSNRDCRNITFCFLNSLVHGRENHIHNFVRLFLRFANKWPEHEKNSLIQALADWCKGHFLEFPPPAN